MYHTPQPPVRDPVFTCATALALALTLAGVAAARPQLPELSDEARARIQDGKIYLVTHHDDAADGAARRAHVTGVVEVAATHAELWDVLLDLDHVRASAKSVKQVDCTLDEPAADGSRTIKLSYQLKIGWMEIRYHVRRSYHEADHYMTWTLDPDEEHDIAFSDGSYSTYDGLTAGNVLFLYDMVVDTGKATPAWLEEDLTESSLKRYMTYVKHVAEAP